MWTDQTSGLLSTAVSSGPACFSLLGLLCRRWTPQAQLVFHPVQPTLGHRSWGEGVRALLPKTVFPWFCFLVAAAAAFKLLRLQFLLVALALCPFSPAWLAAASCSCYPLGHLSGPRMTVSNSTAHYQQSPALYFLYCK